MGTHDRQEKDSAKEKTNYKKIALQTGLFLVLENGLRLTEEKTRRELSGKFFRDWFKSAGSLDGWSDGGKFFTNWIAHPAGGSTSAFIFAQNHPQSRNTTFGRNKDYVHAKGKQFLFALAYSELFELGPISESSIGNVGLYGKKQTYIDHVITPTLGIAWSVGEDALDHHILRPMMQKHRILGKVLAGLLNPTRTMANALAFKPPWYRP